MQVITTQIEKKTDCPAVMYIFSARLLSTVHKGYNSWLVNNLDVN